MQIEQEDVLRTRKTTDGCTETLVTMSIHEFRTSCVNMGWEQISDLNHYRFPGWGGNLAAKFIEGDIGFFYSR